jgi:nucleoside-diphosphate-sugar epimerase
MTKTLVTGAAGFTGRYLASALARRGHEVHGVVHHDPDEPVMDAASVHVADLADRAAIARVVEEVRPDKIVHLAAIAFVGHDDIDEMYRANIVGTRQLLDVLADQDTVPQSVILASSANVYGNARAGVLDETMTPAPANDYGVSKVAAEHVGRLYAGRLPIITARPFNYTGRGQASNFLIPKIVDHARRRAPVIELGNVDVARDFSDVRTVVDAYARLLDAPDAIGGTFNICSGSAVTLRDILDLVGTLSGHRLEVRVNPALVRADEVKTLSGSAARLEAVIGKLDGTALVDTLRWMLDD